MLCLPAGSSSAFRSVAPELCPSDPEPTRTCSQEEESQMLKSNNQLHLRRFSWSVLMPSSQVWISHEKTIVEDLRAKGQDIQKIMDCSYDIELRKYTNIIVIIYLCLYFI